MTTPPGSGDQPQNPGQGWGQQPPSGPQGPGQTPGDQPQQGQWAAPGDQPQQPQQFGQPGQPGQPQQFAQPGQPGQQPWGAPGQPAQPEKKKSTLARLIPIVGGVVAFIVVGILVRSFLGGGVPEAGDCTNDSITQLEVVDCDSAEASYRVAGTVDDVSENELANNPQLCLDDYPNSLAYAVTETDPDEKGTGICLEPV